MAILNRFTHGIIVNEKELTDVMYGVNKKEKSTFLKSSDVLVKSSNNKKVGSEEISGVDYRELKEYRFITSDKKD